MFLTKKIEILIFVWNIVHVTANAKLKTQSKSEHYDLLKKSLTKSCIFQ